MTEDAPDLLTAAEAADQLERSISTVNRWADAGQLPTARKLPGVRGARLFHRSDVEALLAPQGGDAA